MTDKSIMIVVLDLCIFFRFIQFWIRFEFSSQFAEVQCCSPESIKYETEHLHREQCSLRLELMVLVVLILLRPCCQYLKINLN